MTRFHATLLATLAPASLFAQFGTSPPAADMAGVEIREVARIEGALRPVRIAQNPANGLLYVLATSNPDGTAPTTSTLFRLDPAGDGTFTPAAVLDDGDFGAPRAIGLAFAGDGTLFILGNEEVGTTRTRFVLQRGRPGGDGWTWTNVATSEPYLLSRTWFDHRANALAVSPDGARLVINSGARTDHGERYGGVREEGLTALLLQVPADATGLTLPNDRQALKDAGYVYAEGIRNTADLAYAPNGDLLGPDNAGDRDDSEELNWLREGEHYGFPWRIGTSVTPMQFAGYDPDRDSFVQRGRNPHNQADTGWYFSNDPTYPAPPEGVAFVDPIPNAGPFADRYRSEETGDVVDASDTGTTIGTFTGHRSPLGLVFDADSLVAGALRGGAFMLSFNSADEQMLRRLGGTGEDLLYLDLDKTAGAYTVSAERVAHGFVHPIDAVMVENTIYVIEYGSWNDLGDRRAVHAVTLPRFSATASAPLPELPTIHLAAYPNPTAGALTLAYALPEPSAVRIELVDLLGRVVGTVERPAGRQQLVTLSTEGLGPGVYLARLTAGPLRTSTFFTVVR